MKKKIIPYVVLTCLLTACSPQSSDMINGEDTVKDTVIPTTALVSDNDEETAVETSTERETEEPTEAERQIEISVSDNDTDVTEEEIDTETVAETDTESTSETEEVAEDILEYNYLYARALESNKDGFDEVAFFFEVRPSGEGMEDTFTNRETWVDGERKILSRPIGSDIIDGAFWSQYLYEGTSSKMYVCYYIPTGWETFSIKMFDNQILDINNSDLVDEGYLCSTFRKEYEVSFDDVVEDDTFTFSDYGSAKGCSLTYNKHELIKSFRYSGIGGRSYEETASYDGNRIVKFTFDVTAPEDNGGNYPLDTLGFNLYADGEECNDLGFEDIKGYHSSIGLGSYATLYNGERITMYFEIPKDTRNLELVSRMVASSTDDMKLVIPISEEEWEETEAEESAEENDLSFGVE